MTTPELTDDEVNRRLAEAVGWRAVPCTDCGQPSFVARTPEGETLWRERTHPDAKTVIELNCPRYTESLDACATVEAGLKGTHQLKQYRDHLERLVIFTGKRDDSLVPEAQPTLQVWHATATQRARALLATLQP